MGWVFLWRKILAGLFTGIITTLFFIGNGLLMGDPAVIYGGIFILMIALIPIACYGLPVSILADIVVPIKVRFRKLYTLIVHIGFVIIPFTIIELIEPRGDMLSGILFVGPIAFLYWLVDEILIRWMIILKDIPEKKKAKLIFGGLSTVMIFSSLAWFAFNDEGFIKEQPPLTKYYIPEDHSGWVFVFYEQPGKPGLKKEDGYRVIKFNDKGVAWTSTSYEGSSISENKYYFMNDAGNITLIPQERIHYGPISGHTSSSGENYETIEQFFIGTKEEFVRSSERDYSQFLPQPEPEREKYDIQIPDGYNGWVKIDTVDEKTNAPEVEVEIDINKEGEAVVQHSGITIEPGFDNFYYINDSGKTEIPKEHISEIYNFPNLIVFYVGPRETAEPFPYQEYLKDKQ